MTSNRTCHADRIGSILRRTLFAAGLLVSAVPAASAQTAAEEITARVREGDRVSVTDDQGREFKGRISAMTSEGFSILDRDKPAAIRYAEIVKIDRPHDGLGNGALIGLAAGAGLGFLAILTEDRRPCDPEVWFDCSDVSAGGYLLGSAVAGALGAALGTGIDALIRRNPSIYRRGGTRLTLGPKLTNRGAGAAIHLHW